MGCIGIVFNQTSMYERVAAVNSNCSDFVRGAMEPHLTDFHDIQLFKNGKIQECLTSLVERHAKSAKWLEASIFVFVLACLIVPILLYVFGDATTAREMLSGFQIHTGFVALMMIPAMMSIHQLFRVRAIHSKLQTLSFLNQAMGDGPQPSDKTVESVDLTA